MIVSPKDFESPAARDLSMRKEHLPIPRGWKPKSEWEKWEHDVNGSGFSINDVAWLQAYPHLLGRAVGKTKLGPLHSEATLHVWYGPKGEHTSLQAHRGWYKTTAVTEVGPCHYLANYPDTRIGLVRENSTQACESLAVIEAITAHDFYRHYFLSIQGVFPDMSICRGDAMLLACKKTITKEHTVMAFGIETLKVGYHFDIIHNDDIIGLNDRLYKAKRERTIQGIIEIRTNIIDPGCSVHFVGTPWHPEDGWKHCPKPKTYDVYTSGILTPAEIEEKRALTTPSLWAANYELKHMADESSLFKELAAVEPWSMAHPYKAVAHLDAKFSGNHTNALTIMAKLPDGRIRVHGRIWHENVKEIFDDIRLICQKFRVYKLYNEQNPDKGFVADELEKPNPAKALKGITIGGGSHGGRYQEKMNKHVKISTYGLKWWSKLVWDPETDPEYISQVLDYQERQEPDDAPDSLASLLREHFDEGRRSGYGLYE